MDGLSFNFSWKRLVILAALLLVYFLLGGFSPPDMSDSGLYQRNINRSWIYMVALFCSGAVSATLVDHEVGLFPPSNLRALYIILGLILMGSALAWMNSIRNHVVKTTLSSRPANLLQHQTIDSLSARLGGM